MLIFWEIPCQYILGIRNLDLDLLSANCDNTYKPWLLWVPLDQTPEIHLLWWQIPVRPFHPVQCTQVNKPILLYVDRKGYIPAHRKLTFTQKWKSCSVLYLICLDAIQMYKPLTYFQSWRSLNAWQPNATLWTLWSLQTFRKWKIWTTPRQVKLFLHGVCVMCLEAETWQEHRTVSLYKYKPTVAIQRHCCSLLWHQHNLVYKRLFCLFNTHRRSLSFKNPWEVEDTICVIKQKLRNRQKRSFVNMNRQT